MEKESAAGLFRRPIAERALLASAMAEPDSYYDLSSKMTAEDLLDPENRVIFSIMNSLAKKGYEKFDMTALANEAQNHGALQALGGYRYLNSLSMMDLSAGNYAKYLKEVLDASTKFRLYSILKESINILESSEDRFADDAIGDLENKLMDLSTESKSIEEPINIGEEIGSYIASMAENRIELSGVPTGYTILDRQLDGAVPGTLFLIAARKKMGKSAFLTNMACNIAYNENPVHRRSVLYVDTELPYEQWQTRALANISGIKERDIKHGGYTEEQKQKLQKAEELMQTGQLFHHFMPGFSVEKLVALYKKYKIKKNIGFMIFDYIKEPGNRETGRQEHQILGEVTTKMKDLAGELNIPAAGAVQLSRSNDVADSDKISRYADVVAFWLKRSEEEIDASPGHYESGNFKLVIRDSRRGGRTSEEGIAYKFYKQRLAIREVSPELQLCPYDHEGVINEGDAEYEDSDTDTAYDQIRLQ